ncbi:TonB family protein [bacterium]|nr:TonB family protein [bacterium]
MGFGDKLFGLAGTLLLHTIIIVAIAFFAIHNKPKSLLGSPDSKPVEVALLKDPPAPKPEPKRADPPKPKPTPRATPKPEPPKPQPEKKIEVPKETPKATPQPTPRPTPKKTPKPTPKRTPRPEPTPRKTPRPTPAKTPEPKREEELSREDFQKLYDKWNIEKGTKSTTQQKSEPKPTAKPTKDADPDETTVGQATLRGAGLPDSYAKGALAHVGRYFVVPPEQRRDATAIVQFTILRSGELTNIKVRKSSGNANLDALALKALKSAKRFSPLPDSIRKDRVDTEIVFSFTR